MNKFQKGDIVTTEYYESQGEYYTYIEFVPDSYGPHKVTRNKDLLRTSFGEHAELYLYKVEDNAVSPNQEMVAHPNHYGGDTTYEVIKVIEAWGLDNDAFLFNVIKYTARAGKKGKQLEDLKKAAFYLNRRIDSLQEAK